MLSTAVQDFESRHHIQNSFHEVMKNFHELQSLLDGLVKRDEQVGHTGWLSNMCMYFWKVSHNPSLQNICEVGFGNGFTSTIFLTSSKANMTSFDLFPKPGEKHAVNNEMGDLMKYMPLSQQGAIAFLKAKFPGRFTDVSGSSADTVPEFVKHNPNFKCDLILIDGSHQEEATLVDFRNFRHLARQDTIVLIDDLEDPNVDKAVDKAIQQGIIKELVECISGERLIDPAFGHPGWNKLSGNGKKFCRALYNV